MASPKTLEMRKKIKTIADEDFYKHNDVEVLKEPDKLGRGGEYKVRPKTEKGGNK